MLTNALYSAAGIVTVSLSSCCRSRLARRPVQSYRCCIRFWLCGSLLASSACGGHQCNQDCRADHPCHLPPHQCVKIVFGNFDALHLDNASQTMQSGVDDPIMRVKKLNSDTLTQRSCFPGFENAWTCAADPHVEGSCQGRHGAWKLT